QPASRHRRHVAHLSPQPPTIRRRPGPGGSANRPPGGRLLLSDAAVGRRGEAGPEAGLGADVHDLDDRAPVEAAVALDLDVLLVGQVAPLLGRLQLLEQPVEVADFLRPVPTYQRQLADAAVVVAVV